MSQDGAQILKKIDAEIDQKIDAFQDTFLEQFWWILGRKMEASWYQHGNKNRYQLCISFYRTTKNW